MTAQPTENSGLDAHMSVDDMLNDIELTRHASGEQAESHTSPSRRKRLDRRTQEAKKPRGTVERRLEDDRRGKLAKAKKQKQGDQAELKLQQHRKKILLAGCEPVMGLNYDHLAMDDYPDNTLVAEARRDRDYWVVICAVFASLFVFSLLGVLDPWIGGVGCGLAFLAAVFAFSSARKFFFARPPLHELLAKRKLIEYAALHHIQYLEGVDGLAWRCAKLAKYNSNLEKKLFAGLYRYSKKRSLLSYLHNKKTIRLYLLLMMEAQKAYKRLEKDYLESHFQHLDQGWDDRIDDAEASKLEQSLNKPEKVVSKELKS